MVEVVGTAPTSAMFITKFVYRHSWKSNEHNIKIYKADTIKLLLNYLHKVQYLIYKNNVCQKKKLLKTI